MCIFKALHKDPKQQHQDLSLDEFYSFYEMQDFRWKRVSLADPPAAAASYIVCVRTPSLLSIAIVAGL